jgi:PilZ domain
MRAARPQRFKRRLSVQFSTGDGALPRAACTLDLSASGLFLNTRAPLSPGTHLLGRLALPDGSGAEVHGIVAWRKAVPYALNAIAHGGLGIRLVWAEPRYFEYLAANAA